LLFSTKIDIILRTVASTVHMLEQQQCCVLLYQNNIAAGELHILQYK